MDENFFKKYIEKHNRESVSKGSSLKKSTMLHISYENRKHNNPQLLCKYRIGLNATPGSIFHSGFLGEVLFKFDLPWLLIEMGFY